MMALEKYSGSPKSYPLNYAEAKAALSELKKCEWYCPIPGQMIDGELPLRRCQFPLIEKCLDAFTHKVDAAKANQSENFNVK
jgi:hypothetical protein